MPRARLQTILLLNLIPLFLVLGIYLGQTDRLTLPVPNWKPGDLLSPYVSHEDNNKPLLRWSIPNLVHYPYQAPQLQLDKVISQHENYTAYQFSYLTTDRMMTGQLNLPNELIDRPDNQPDQDNLKAIIMLRGYVPPATYQTGVGTRNAAAVFAENGYITLAPDFFAFGGSDPEPEDGWEARFIKPVNVIELMRGLQTHGVPLELSSSDSQDQPTQPITSLGLWGHSNGGQIALTVLQITQEPIPTTLWAPVTAPFPYSILFFSATHDDEGKGMRSWLAQLERDYDVFEFSLTQHLDKLTGPLQLHHGLGDEAAPYWWSDRFEEMIISENERREKLVEKIVEQSKASTPSTDISDESHLTDPIDFRYYRYPGTDHNMRPNWSTVVQRDLEFFEEWL